MSPSVQLEEFELEHEDKNNVDRSQDCVHYDEICRESVEVVGENLVGDVLEVVVHETNQRHQHEGLGVVRDEFAVEPVWNVLDNVVRCLEVVAHEKSLFYFRTVGVVFQGEGVA